VNEEVKINGEEVEYFMLCPQDTYELHEILEGIIERLSHSDGSIRRCLLYNFSDTEIDLIKQATEYLLDKPVFK